MRRPLRLGSALVQGQDTEGSVTSCRGSPAGDRTGSGHPSQGDGMAEPTVHRPPAAITRPFAEAHIGPARDLWRETEHMCLSSADGPDDLRAFLLRNPGCSVVALEDGRFVGTCLCGHDGRRGHLYHLAVAGTDSGSGWWQGAWTRFVRQGSGNATHSSPARARMGSSSGSLRGGTGVTTCTSVRFARSPVGARPWRARSVPHTELPGTRGVDSESWAIHARHSSVVNTVTPMSVSSSTPRSYTPEMASAAATILKSRSLAS